MASTVPSHACRWELPVLSISPSLGTLPGSECLWISQGTPSISKITLPEVLGNGVTPVLRSRLPGSLCRWNMFSLWRWNMFSPALSKSHPGFPAVLELCRVVSPSPGLQGSRTHFQGCPMGTPQPFHFVQRLLLLWKMQNAMNTAFCSLSFIVSQSYALGAKILKCKVLFHEKLLSRDKGSKASAAAQSKACGFSISHCNHCMGSVSLPDPFSNTEYILGSW